MEASQLKIDPNHLRFKPMSRSQRNKLRHENIKALIKSKPAGTIISHREFEAVTHSSNISSLLNTMLKRHEIVKIPSETHKSRFSWAVTDGVKVKQVATKSPAKNAVKAYTIQELSQLAREYVWDNDSDSLRGFIKSLEDKAVL